MAIKISGSTIIDDSRGIVNAGISTFNNDVTFLGASYNATWDKSDNSLIFADNTKAKFGTDGELDIYHNGTDSFIEHSGTGDLFIRNYVDDADILIQTDAGDGSLTTYLRADGDTGEVQLYHYGSEKLATKSTGVTVTGAVCYYALW